MAYLPPPSKSSAGTYWSTKTDDELLSTQLTTDDPESLEELSEDQPPDEEALVEMAYNVSGRERGMVRCVFCKHPNHFNGVVMRYKSGTRRLVGRDCAGKHYGVTFDLLARDFDAARDRRDYVEQQRLVMARDRDILGMMATMRADPSVAEFGEVRRRLREFVGEKLWPKLVRIADGDGRLVVERRVINYAAMETGRGRQSVFALVGDRYLRGAELVRSGPTVAERLRDIEERLTGVVATLRRNDASTTTLRQNIVMMSDLLCEVERERVRMRAVNTFFDGSNGGGLCEFASWLVDNGKQGVSVLSLPYRLYDQGRSNGHLELCPSPHYRIPGADLIEVMRDTTVRPSKRRKASR
ncbi:MAG: hypothetical protein PGN34_13985 [Methylobacterium frigidaeris]